VVYANRTDRATIESLIKVLDSPEVPEMLASDRVQMLPVKNTSALRMERMLQDLYGAQMGSISVEEKTNSLIVMASPATFEQIKQVVELLDTTAGGKSGRTIEIIRLRSASSERVEQALNIILREHGQRRPGTYSRSRPRAPAH
jgi:type II secretory pathway component GspD/PulD (secretin)